MTWGTLASYDDMGFFPCRLQSLIRQLQLSTKSIQWMAVEWFPTLFIMNRTELVWRHQDTTSDFNSLTYDLGRFT